MNTSTTTRKPQHLAYKLGIMIGLLGLAVLLLPAYDKFHACGPMNSGHDTLKCESPVIRTRRAVYASKFRLICTMRSVNATTWRISAIKT